MDGKMKREKNYNIELLRVLSCFLVICIHVSNYYSRGFGSISQSSYLFSLVVNGISRIAVPIFFMISGALLLEEPIRLEKSVQRTMGLLIPLVGWSILYSLWNLWYRNQDYALESLFEAPVKRHLWFLYALFGIYLILPFLQCMLQNMSKQLLQYFVVLLLLFLTVNSILAFLQMEVTYPIPLVGSSCYLTYFIMGYVLNHFAAGVRVRKWICCLVSGLAIAGTILATYYHSLACGQHLERYFEYRNVLVGIGAAGVFLAVVGDKPYAATGLPAKGINLIAKHSFTIYLAHVLFLDIVKQELFPRELASWIGIPMFSLGIFGVTLLFSVVLHIIWKYFKRWFQGRFPIES